VKKFKLTRYMKYSEVLEIEAESWDEAKRILRSDVEFERRNDDELDDESIEFCGDIENT